MAARKKTARKVAVRKKTVRKKASGKSSSPKSTAKKSTRKTSPRSSLTKKPVQADLLFEIGTEELPSSSLARLGEALGKGLRDQLAASDLVATDANYTWFATPRRLAVRIDAVAYKQPDQDVERRGPAVKAAFDDEGNPTRAALGFAQSCGVDIDKLGRLETDKGEWLAFRERSKGKTAKALIPHCVDKAVSGLPIAKRMRWGEGDAEFARPVHWIVLLHGPDVVRATVLGKKSDRLSRGHRFHCRRVVRLSRPDKYETELKNRGLVIASFAERRSMVRAQAEKLGAKVKGKAVISDALLDEVTSLVELPTAIIGNIDSDFMSLPAEVLVSSMQDHQKYFPVQTSRGKLLPHFITVSNLKLSNPARIRNGNERVLRSRLADARFFWDTDQKLALGDRIAALEGVLFHKALGNTRQKAERLEHIARALAGKTGVDGALAARAALLAKADLVTDMVGEFAELQGTVGSYYAARSGEDKAVARAIGEHYMPRFAGDVLPASDIGKIVALADKVDTITGIFAAGEEPSGDRDPYGLRRAALGVLRILSEGSIDLDIGECVSIARDAYSSQGHAKLALDDAAHQRMVSFMLDRLRAHYNSAGFSTDEINAVRAAGSARPLDFEQRLKAVAGFRKLDAARSLAAANKRIQNILKKSPDDAADSVDAERFTEDEERTLHAAARQSAKRVAPLVANGDYVSALAELAKLREPVDAFFNEVMVMVDDDALKRNRLALLRTVGEQFMNIADISLLQD